MPFQVVSLDIPSFSTFSNDFQNESPNTRTQGFLDLYAFEWVDEEELGVVLKRYVRERRVRVEKQFNIKTKRVKRRNKFIKRQIRLGFRTQEEGEELLQELPDLDVVRNNNVLLMLTVLHHNNKNAQYTFWEHEELVEETDWDNFSECIQTAFEENSEMIGHVKKELEKEIDLNGCDIYMLNRWDIPEAEEIRELGNFLFFNSNSQNGRAILVSWIEIFVEGEGGGGEGGEGGGEEEGDDEASS